MKGDPSWQMLKQATGGPVDFITGDYLAGKRPSLYSILSALKLIMRTEMNLAENAEAFRAGEHPGYVETAWAGLEESIDVIAEYGIKVVINGGSINPSGLAEKVAALVCHQILSPLLISP